MTKQTERSRRATDKRYPNYATFATGSFRFGAAELDVWGRITDNVRWFTTKRAALEWARPNFVKFALMEARTAS